MTYRETKTHFGKERVYDLLCRYCGQEGTASFSWEEAHPFWQIGSLSKGFYHNEHSQGGAEIYCSHEGRKCLVCDPNGTGNPDNICTKSREKYYQEYDEQWKTEKPKGCLASFVFIALGATSLLFMAHVI